MHRSLCAHLDDGDTAAEASNALVELLLLVLLIGVGHQVADLLHAGSHVLLGAAVTHDHAALLGDNHLQVGGGVGG